METSVNLAHLQTKISRLICTDMKKQQSLRWHLFSGFLVMVDMLHALRSLWDVLLPFALLWWNMMRCATCAKYYSWNRSRFRLQMAGRRFYGEVMAESDCDEQVRQISPQTDDAEDMRQTSHRSENGETKVIACYKCRSCTQALSAQEVEVSSHLLQQSRLWSKDCNGDTCLCQNELEVFDPHADSTGMCVGKCPDNQFRELSSCQSSSMCDAHVLKTIDIILSPSHTSTVSSLHFTGGTSTHQSELLRAAYLAACPFLLQQPAGLIAIPDTSHFSQKLLEYVWMRSALCIHRNLVNVRSLTQLLNSVIVNSLSVEECVQILNLSFASMIHGRHHAHLATQFLKLLTTVAHSGKYSNRRLGLPCPVENNLTENHASLDPSQGIVKGTHSQIGEHPSLSNIVDLALMSDVCSHERKEEDGSEERVHSGEYTNRQLTLPCSIENNLTERHGSLDSVEGIVRDSHSKIGDSDSDSLFMSDACSCERKEEVGSEERDGTYSTPGLFHGGNNGIFVSNSQSSIDLDNASEDGDAIKSRQFTEDDVYSAHPAFAKHHEGYDDVHTDLFASSSESRTDLKNIFEDDDNIQARQSTVDNTYPADHHEGYYDGDTDLIRSGSQSSVDLNTVFEDGDMIQPRQFTVDSVCAAYLGFSDYHEGSMSGSVKDAGFPQETHVHLEDNYFDLCGQATSGDVRYAGLHWLQGVDDLYARYSAAVGRVSNDQTHCPDGSEDGHDVSMIHGKHHAHLATQFLKLLTAVAHSGEYSNRRLAKTCPIENNLTENHASSDFVKGIMKGTQSEIREPSSSNVLDSSLMSDAYSHERKEEDASEDGDAFKSRQFTEDDVYSAHPTFAEHHEGYDVYSAHPTFAEHHEGYDDVCTDLFISSSQSSTDLNNIFEDGDKIQARQSSVDNAHPADYHEGSDDGDIDLIISSSRSSTDFNTVFKDGDTIQPRQFTVDNVYPAYVGFCDHHEGSMSGSVKDAGFLQESYIHLEDNYVNLRGQATDWNVRYVGPHWLQGVDDLYIRYSGAVDRVSNDHTQCTDGFEDGHDAFCGDVIYEENVGGHSNSEEVTQSCPSVDTWWDEDAVVLGGQGHEENNGVDQAWQMV